MGIALIGAGRMGRVHATSIMAAGGELATVYDPMHSASIDLAQQCGAEVSDSSGDAMNRSDVDAIIIATSSDTHIDLLYEAVQAGKPALCEKPLSPDYQKSLKFIQDIGEKATQSIFLGFNRRFDRGHVALRETVHAGEIGKLEQLIITSRDPYPPTLAYIPHSGGLFRDMMIHDFDMVRSIVRSKIVNLHAQGASIIDKEIGKLGDIDTATVTMTTEDNAMITILNSRRCVFGYDQRIEAFGSNGMALSDNPRQSSFQIFTKETIGKQAPLFEFFMERYINSYTEEIRIFLECARTASPMPVDAKDGLMASYLAEAADVSLQKGITIELTDTHQKF